eukprot:5043296-Pyramimonas_sp.AAC.1
MANTFEALELFKRELAERNVNIVGLLRDPVDHETADTILLRFLRARQNDVHEALALLQEDVAWREELSREELPSRSLADVIGCDGDTTRRLMELEELAGFDHEGRLVLFCDIRKLPAVCRRLPSGAALASLLKFHVWKQERMTRVLPRLAAVMGGDSSAQAEGVTVMLDLDGASEGARGAGPDGAGGLDLLEYIQTMVTIDERHYPERVAQLVL